MRLGCSVIGVDAHPLACGLLLPLVPRVGAPASSPAYASDMGRLCGELRPDAIMPTVDDELVPLLAMRARLDHLGARTWLPDLAALETCGDKALFHAALDRRGIPTPATVLPERVGEIEVGRGLVVKPRRGHGAQGVHFCATRRQARVLCELVPDPIVQERLTGREFTADCLVDREGHASVILRYRLVIKAGLAFVAATFHDDEVADLVKTTLTAVGAVGLCCVQGFVRDHDATRVVITEVNPRIAGGFPLAEAAGAHLVEQALNGVLSRPIDHGGLAYRSGVRLTKYIETLATSEGPIEAPATGEGPNR